MSRRIKFVQKLIALNEALFFYPRLRKFYRKKIDAKDILLIDVGANKGQSIDFFRSVNSHISILAFEPNKKLFGLLQKKYASISGIELYQLGVSEQSGELTFHESVLDETSTFEQLNLNSSYLQKKARILGVKKESIFSDAYQVPVTSLADFLAIHPVQKIDILKLDVEGHELSCLKGLFEKKTDIKVHYIQLESHNDDMYKNRLDSIKITSFLMEYGFEEAARIRHGFGNFYEVIYENKTPL